MAAQGPPRPGLPLGAALHIQGILHNYDWGQHPALKGDAARQTDCFEGNHASRFDTAWLYERDDGGDFDVAMLSLEDCADRVDEVGQGSVQKKAREADLLVCVEAMRDGLEKAVKGDKLALSHVFSANSCERIGRLRLIIATTQLEVYNNDPRWEDLLVRVQTIEGMLRELGTYRPWRPSAQHTGLMRRHNALELNELQRCDSARRLCVDPGAPAGLPSPLAKAPVEEAVGPGQPQEEEDSAKAGPGASEDLAIADPSMHGANYCADGHDLSIPLDALQVRTASSRCRRPVRLLEGWVWKRSRYLQCWRRRYLILSPGKLESFKPGRSGSGPDDDCRATETWETGILEQVYSASPKLQIARAFALTVHKRVCGNRTFYIVCDTEAEKTEW
eukprot:CAMPEP_0170581704 /NCGR_PEP_ID=MMETSP0224-20130122/7185_1 /TAXON_ID=285029 /ORGANISM="Togula jolla, Strain CCCM 725" /LENGTH=389 /DNA_ID=CAMNT_0010904865 /DNA_START=78 /DNA_END=1244 /DNA_ORIENTATION=+